MFITAVNNWRLIRKIYIYFMQLDRKLIDDIIPFLFMLGCPRPRRMDLNSIKKKLCQYIRFQVFYS